MSKSESMYAVSNVSPDDGWTPRCASDSMTRPTSKEAIELADSLAATGGNGHTWYVYRVDHLPLYSATTHVTKSVEGKWL